MVSVPVWDWVVVAIYRWAHSDRGHFELVPFDQIMQ